MSGSRTLGLPWTTVNACTTTAVFVPATQWMEGVIYPTDSKVLGAAVQAKQSVRFGWMVKNSSGAVMSSGRIGGQILITTC